MSNFNHPYLVKAAWALSHNRFGEYNSFNNYDGEQNLARGFAKRLLKQEFGNEDVIKFVTEFDNNASIAKGIAHVGISESDFLYLDCFVNVAFSDETKKAEFYSYIIKEIRSLHGSGDKRGNVDVNPLLRKINSQNASYTVIRNLFVISDNLLLEKVHFLLGNSEGEDIKRINDVIRSELFEIGNFSKKHKMLEKIKTLSDGIKDALERIKNDPSHELLKACGLL